MVWFSDRSGNSRTGRYCSPLDEAGKEAGGTAGAGGARFEDMMSDQSILVTGAAGFIGFHVSRALLAAGRTVVGLDNINSYYDPALKQARLGILRGEPRFAFEQINLADRASI